MKIINEKGKLFGIINVVDLLVLVAAIAVVAGVGYKLFAKQIKEVASPQVSLTMTVNAVPGKRGAAQQPGRQVAGKRQQLCQCADHRYEDR